MDREEMGLLDMTVTSRTKVKRKVPSSINIFKHAGEYCVSPKTLK